MNLPKVHSPTLLQALEEVAPAITGWAAMLDRLDADSLHDIRAVETWLLNSGIRHEVEVVYAAWWEPAEMVGVRRALAWARDLRRSRRFGSHQRGHQDASPEA